MFKLLVYVWWGGFVGQRRRLGRLVGDFWHPPNLAKQDDIEKDPALSRAYRWVNEYVPERDDEVYGAILDFAKDRYKEINKVSEELDRKADDLLKISATIGAALAAAGRVVGIQAVLTTAPILAAITCLLTAMLIAARARRPTANMLPFTIRTAIEVAEQSRLPPSQINPLMRPSPHEMVPPRYRLTVPPSANQVKATIAASYDWAATATEDVGAWKARLVRAANSAFCLGVALLILGLTGPVLWEKLLSLIAR